MDLGAYMQIEKHRDILSENGIEIARLRGIRMMAKEEAISEDEINEMIEESKLYHVVNWLRQHDEFSWSSTKADKKHPAFIYAKKKGEGYEGVIGYDFKKIHGDDRKHLKKKFKEIEKAYRAQYDMFNQYVGKNVLYVHARQGGWNRYDYPIDKKHPMYLSDVDDSFDNTYCDIYYDLDKAVKKDVPASEESGE